MNIRTLLQQQGVYSPTLERDIIDALNQGKLDIPNHSIPLDPDQAEELEWIDPLDLTCFNFRSAA